MRVNPDVDGFTKILNHRKILRNTQKSNNLLNTTGKLKYKLRFIELSRGGDI